MSGVVAKEVVVSTISQLYGSNGVDPPEGAPGFVDDLVELGTGFVEASVDTLRAFPAMIGLDFTNVADGTSSETETRIRRSFESASGGRGALAALAFMVFVLLYTPCMAAVGALRNEFGSRWALTSVIGQFAIAWLAAFAVFQGGRLLGFG
jgi:ferrous iron transport protein B